VEIYWVAGGGVMVAALMASFRVQVQMYRRLARLDERLAHLTAGISLLADTAEGGLRDVAVEVERLRSVAATKGAGRDAASRLRRRTARAIGAGHRGAREDVGR
jgi:hypothetical protein